MTEEQASPVPAARRGRARAFDRAAALERALDLFWRRGYAGVELRDLTRAMGIHPPSFYAAFGDRDALFAEAAALYAARYVEALGALLAAPTARAGVRAVWGAAVDAFTAVDAPRGCFLTVGAVNCPKTGVAAAAILADHRARGAALIRERLARGLREGDLPPGTDVEGLAAYVGAVSAGLSMLARDGASAEALRAVVDTALGALPGGA